MEPVPVEPVYLRLLPELRLHEVVAEVGALINLVTTTLEALRDLVEVDVD
jgi:hypothetical protein